MATGNVHGSFGDEIWTCGFLDAFRSTFKKTYAYMLKMRDAM